MAFGQTNTGFQAGNNMFSTGFNSSFSGGLVGIQTSVNNTQVKTQKKDDDTYNPRYPGLNEEQYKKLEKMVSDKGLTGKEARDIMDQLYKVVLPKVQNGKKLDERQQELNNSIYQNSQNFIDGNKEVTMGTDLTTLAQEAKKKYNIPYNKDDNELIKEIIEGTPNGNRLAYEYTQNGNPEIFYAAGIWDKPQKEEEDGGFFSNVIGGAYDSATSLPRLGAKKLADAIGWTAKKLGADDAKTDELVQGYKDYLDNERSGKAIGANQDSLTYNISKGVGDFAQVMAGEGLLKAGIQNTARGGQLMEYLKTAPTRQKMVAGGLEGAGDMALFSIVSENKLPTTGEEAIGAGLGAFIPGAGALYKAGAPAVKKYIKNIAPKLELSGMLNPAKLNAIKNQLIEEGTDLASAGLKGGNAEDVGTWMIERGFKGDKPTIIKDLGDYGDKAHKLKREILGASDTLHDVESAKKSLQIIYDTIEDVPGLEKKIARVEELMSKDKHTLAELDEIKSILDDTKNLYTMAGTPKAGAVNQGLVNVRKNLRKYIEDAAAKENLGNVKMLNNETQISKSLQDAISRKDSADSAREILGVFSKPLVGGALGTGVGPFDSDTIGGKVGNFIIGALAGRYLFSTKAKTNIASMINKMSGGSKKELERWIAGDLTLKGLSKETRKELTDIFSKANPNKVQAPAEMTAEEYEALLKHYSKQDLPALEFREGVNDAGKNILAGDSEKIISTPQGVSFREGQIAEIPSQTTDIASLNKKSGNVKIPDYNIYKGISKEIIDNGGITLDVLKKNNLGGKPFVAVSPYPNRSKIIKVDDFNDSQVFDYFKENADKLFEDGYVLGGWVNKGDVYLDVSIALPKSMQKEAVEIANKYNQKAIFDLETFEDIPTAGNGEFMEVNEEEISNYIKSLFNKKK